MRRIVTNTFVTLDGIMQAPGAPEEDRSGNFKFGGWSVNYWDDIMGKAMDEASKTPYDLLLGRKTYEIFAAHWPFMNDDPMANKFNKATKYVATKTLKSATWENTTLLNGDLVQQIKKIKSANGIEIQVHGSSNLLQTLFRYRLVDELNVWIFPCVIGTGKRMFEEEALASNFKMVNHKVSGTGVVIATYVPNGDIQPGSFALKEPSALEMERRAKVEKDGKDGS